MSVTQMKTVSIIGLIPNLDNVIKICGKSGIFHPDDVSSFYSDTRNFVPIAQKNPYSEPYQDLKDTFTMAEIKPENVDTSKFEPSFKEISSFVDFITENFGKLLADQADAMQNIEQCEKSIEEMSHFLGFDLEMDKIFACRYIKSNFGRLPIESFQKLENYKDNPYVAFFPCTKDDTHYWGVYISPLEEADNVDRIFSGLFFEHCDMVSLNGARTPEEYYEKLKVQLVNYKQVYTKAAEKTKQFKKAHLKECMMFFNKLNELNTYFSIKNYVLKYHKSFVLVGWIPADKADELENELNKIPSIECDFTDGKEQIKNSPPIKLKHNRLVRPFEFYVEMYGLPLYNEIDPTLLVAITYTVMFGAMFGDVGQGIVLSITGYLMWKLKKMAVGKILIPCGISSAVFGCIYGSVFGFEEALNPLYSSLFGLSEKPVDVMGKDTNTLIYSAVGAGITLIILAMALNIISSLKRRDYENALFSPNGVAGFIFFAATVTGIIATMLFGVELLSLPYIIILMVLPLIAIYLKEPLGRLVEGRKDWKPEKWSEYFVQSFFELFETILSYLSNAMSFIRVGAFALVHAGMMLVVFTIADMLSPGIGYWIAVIIGNGFVMALEALLVAIQVLRLEFYEMFSRFYIGQGRAYNPVKVKPLNDK